VGAIDAMGVEISDIETGNGLLIRVYRVEWLCYPAGFVAVLRTGVILVCLYLLMMLVVLF